MKLAVGIVTGILLACTSAPPPGIAVQTTSADDLTGRWVGEYSSPATGRRGTIFFDLTGNRAEAKGFVAMYANVVPESALTTATDVLAIDFVRAANGRITGQLAPYRDPATGSTLRTRFEGRQNGDVIEGTFESHAAGSDEPLRGTWKVTRQRR